MPEQSVPHQEEIDSDQQTHYYKKLRQHRAIVRCHLKNLQFSRSGNQNYSTEIGRNLFPDIAFGNKI